MKVGHSRLTLINISSTTWESIQFIQIQLMHIFIFKNEKLQ